MNRFAASTGIDSRLLLFIPLSTLFTVLALTIPAWLLNDPTVTGVRELVQMSALIFGFAIVFMPITLPPALVIWVFARVLCWKAGWPAYRSAILAGFMAGVGAVFIAVLFSSYPVTITHLAICAIVGVSGMFAAAIVYWEGWAKWASKNERDIGLE